MLNGFDVPSPLRPNRLVSLLLSGTALTLAGFGLAGTTGAATPAPAARLTAAVAHHARKKPASRRTVRHAAARRRGRTALPPRDRVLPTAVSGPQAYLPMTPARKGSATTIVRQALGRHMGLRSAVIAVATAMQESALLNVQYGTYDSLGLFQQRPSAGWGTPAQVTNPTYASDAFLNALRHYQASHPGWATQPMWRAAQGVQDSAFPYAYAKWERQAARIVGHIAWHRG